MQQRYRQRPIAPVLTQQNPMASVELLLTHTHAPNFRFIRYRRHLTLLGLPRTLDFKCNSMRQKRAMERCSHFLCIVYQQFWKSHSPILKPGPDSMMWLIKQGLLYNMINYYQSIIIQIVWYLHWDCQIDQWNRTQSPKIGLLIDEVQMYGRLALKITRERLFNKWYWDNRIST